MGSHLSIETQNHPVDSEQIIIAKHLLINRIKDLIKGIARTRGGLFGMLFIIPADCTGLSLQAKR